MKIFNSTRKIYEILGVCQFRAFEKQSFEIRFWLNLIGITIGTILASTGFIFEANTFPQYTECFYGVITTSICTMNLLVILFRLRKMIELIEDFETTTTKRMY